MNNPDLVLKAKKTNSDEFDVEMTYPRLSKAEVIMMLFRVIENFSEEEKEDGKCSGGK
jgi:hypothetical protein